MTQKRFDENTDLYYFGSRHYDPTNSVWLTQDRYRGDVFDPVSLHRYLYNYGSPNNYLDRWGFSGEEDFTQFNSKNSFNLTPLKLMILNSSSNNSPDSLLFNLLNQNMMSGVRGRIKSGEYDFADLVAGTASSVVGDSLGSAVYVGAKVCFGTV